MNELPRKDLATPKLAMTLGFVISLAAAVVLFQRASGAGDGPVEADTIYWILFGAMVVGGLTFCVSLAKLASRLGRSPIAWVGLAILTSPIGAFVAFPWMLIIVSKAQKDSAAPPE